MSSGSLADISDVTSITLALRTLGSFDFEGKLDMFMCTHMCLYVHVPKHTHPVYTSTYTTVCDDALDNR